MQPDAQMIVTWLSSDYNFFQNGTLRASMNEDLGKFVYDSMPQRTKKRQKP
jgi:hypothetical protein